MGPINKAMVAKCCAPGCRSNYNITADGYVRVFKLPRNEQLRAVWLSKIARDDLRPNKYTVLCIKHFAPEALSYKYVYSDQTGYIKEFPYEKPRLQKDAVPTIFEKLSKKALKRLVSEDKLARKQIKQEVQDELPLSVRIKKHTKFGGVNKPRLKSCAVPKLIDGPVHSKRLRPKKRDAVDDGNSNHEEVLISEIEPLNTTKKKRGRKKKIADPLDIKNEVNMETSGITVIHTASLTNCVSYVDSQSLFQSESFPADMKVKDRLAALEAENSQLKTKYSQLINDYVQMKTEKIQLKAELDAALSANQKLIIVKNSLVTTIQTLGKMSDAPVRVNGIPATIQLDPTIEVSDTIIGF